MKLSAHFRFFAFHVRQHSQEIAKALRTGGVKAAMTYVVTLIKGVWAWYNPKVAAQRQSKSDFDKKWGTDTSGMISPKFLDMAGQNAVFSNYYRATRPRLFRLLMASLKIDFERFVFVDYGSGKGFINLLASEFPFKKIIGVELSEKLHAIAQQNALKYNSPTQKCRDIEFVCMDATQHELPPDPVVVFFFEPFIDEKIFAKMVRNLELSLEKHPREMAILYVGLDFRKCIEDSKYFTVTYEENPAMAFRSVSRRSVGSAATTE